MVEFMWHIEKAVMPLSDSSSLPATSTGISLPLGHSLNIHPLAPPSPSLVFPLFLPLIQMNVKKIVEIGWIKILHN